MNKDEREKAVRWYAREHDMTVFTNVPRTRAGWNRWGPETWRRTATVAVSSGEGEVRPFPGDDEFRAVLPDSSPIRPILPPGWGVGRYALGWLVAYKAYFKRSWEPSASVEPAVLVAPGEEQSNVATAFEATGLGVVVLPRLPPKPPARRGQPAINDPWERPKTNEDRALHKLWLSRPRKNRWWLAEVPIGWGAPRRLDAAVIPWREPRHSGAGAEIDKFRKAVKKGRPVELIEAKCCPNEEALGQLLGGQIMFSGDYPGHGELSLTACVWEPGDEALDWLYAQYPVVDIAPVEL